MLERKHQSAPSHPSPDTSQVEMAAADVANGEGDTLDGGGDIPVRFRIHGTQASRVAIVGDFNAWSVISDPMERSDEGFERTIRLGAGRRYHYRFLVDDERWALDPHADAQVVNADGTTDSVIDLTPPTTDR